VARARYGLLLRFNEAEFGVADEAPSLVASAEVLSADGGLLAKFEVVLVVFEEVVDELDDSVIRLGSKLGSTSTSCCDGFGTAIFAAF
jgi:hypothetical protein